MQYIKVENNGYVNQVQADPRIIFDNHGKAYQVQDNQNHGFVNEIQTGPNHGYITQVQTGPNSYHGYINEVQCENSGYDNQDETEPNHGYITQVQTGPNSYHGYINQVQENYGDNETEPNYGYIIQVQTGPKNHGYINHVQTGPTRGAEPGMLAHHPILQAVEAKPVPSKDLHTFRRPNPKVEMENQGYNNQVQTGPTRGAEPGMLAHHRILQTVEAKPVPSKELHTFRRPEHKVEMENQGYNNQIQTGTTGAAEPEMLKHHPILQAVEAKPVSSKDFHTFRRPYPRGKFEHHVEQRGM